MKKLEHLSPDTEFIYWIENFLISRLRAEKFVQNKNQLDDGADISYEDVVKSISLEHLLD
jgi:hypothetical protein